ncbi:hypothetical protein [Kineococcus sp. SYSU DK002]|uniref:hypothetical protein n=1 Tax=Kineococcus sp. SYSU DK002 TaxID=3383123 RepID=UPI003D7DB971
MPEEPPDDVLAYQHRLTQLNDADLDHDHALLQQVLTDPDELVSDAAITQHLDRVARERHTAAAFTAWVEDHLDALPAGTHRRRRAEQWRTYKQLLDNPAQPLDLDVVDDWTQHRLAEGSHEPSQLWDLSRAGRTRRIRAQAHQRLLRVQHDNASTSTSTEVLQRLANTGLTRQIRTTAQQRLDALSR